MKKLIFAFLFVAGTSFTFAQTADFGAKAGVNFASLEGDGLEGLDGRTSFHLGLVAEIHLTEKFSIQPEVLYSGLGATASEGDGTIKLDYISIPVMAKFYVTDGLSLEAGPQIAFNVVAEAEADGETEDIEDIESTDFSAGFGLGYQLPMGVFFQGRYNLGLTEVWKLAEVKNNVIQLSVGYKF